MIADRPRVVRSFCRRMMASGGSKELSEDERAKLDAERYKKELEDYKSHHQLLQAHFKLQKVYDGLKHDFDGVVEKATAKYRAQISMGNAMVKKHEASVVRLTEQLAERDAEIEKRVEREQKLKDKIGELQQELKDGEKEREKVKEEKEVMELKELATVQLRANYQDVKWELEKQQRINKNLAQENEELKRELRSIETIKFLSDGEYTDTTGEFTVDESAGVQSGRSPTDAGKGGNYIDTLAATPLSVLRQGVGTQKELTAVEFKRVMKDRFLVTDGEVVHSIFTAVDVKSTGRVDTRDLMIAMSFLFKGSQIDVVKFQTSVYGLNDDVPVTKNQAVEILHAFLRRGGDIADRLSKRFSVWPEIEDIHDIISEMKYMPTGEWEMSLAEFKKALFRSMAFKECLQAMRDHVTGVSDDMEETAVPRNVPVYDLQQELGFGKISLMHLLKSLIYRHNMKKEDLHDLLINTLGITDERVVDPYYDELVTHGKTEDFIDRKDALCALSLVCFGKSLAKLEFSFRACDVNGKTTLDYRGFLQMMDAFFRRGGTAFVNYILTNHSAHADYSSDYLALCSNFKIFEAFKDEDATEQFVEEAWHTITGSDDRVTARIGVEDFMAWASSNTIVSGFLDEVVKHFDPMRGLSEYPEEVNVDTPRSVTDTTPRDSSFYNTSNTATPRGGTPVHMSGGVSDSSAALDSARS